MMQRLRMLTAGESHGPRLTAVLEGMPAGLGVSEAAINEDLRRRQVGYGRGRRMAIEADAVTITAGVRRGVTIGSPICLEIENRDWVNWQEEMSPLPPPRDWQSRRAVRVPRPGHADLAGAAKFGHRDMRNVLERASARETAARVAVGAVCRLLLAEFGIRVRAFVTSIGDVAAPAHPEGEQFWQAVENSDVRCADPDAAAGMRAAIDAARERGDTLGGTFAVYAEGVPAGLGSNAHWDRRLDAALAAAIMSIPAIKAVEIGDGVRSAGRPGSLVHDPILPAADDKTWPFARPTNHCGGIEGGISNGQPLIMRAYMKPIPTLVSPLPSVSLDSLQAVQAHAERSDVCAVPAAAVVGEAMVCLVLADALLAKFGGDTVQDTLAAYNAYLARLPQLWE